MTRAFDFLRVRDLPLMSRPSFVAEMGHFLLWGVVVGAVEGNIAGIVAKKTFGAGSLLTSVVWAIPVFAHALNVFWGAIIRGRRKTPLVFLLVCGAAISVSSIALNRSTVPFASAIFAAQMLATHLFLTGLVTLRTSIWNANYPRSRRAEITGQLHRMRLVVSLAASAAISHLFDLDAALYRYIYPGVAIVALLSLAPMRRFRVRGEKKELRVFHDRYRSGANPGGGAPDLFTSLREARQILRNDRTFSEYMVAQNFLGSANFFSDPILLSVLTGTLHYGYFVSSLLMLQLPILMTLFTLGVWGRFFDRVGVLRFRVVNSQLWIVSTSLLTLSMLIIGFADPTWWTIAMVPLVVSRLIQGVSGAAGAIAWNLGHLQFANPHQLELYMGIHVALTGVRGLTMPLIGAGAHMVLGNFSFLIAVFFAIVAYQKFSALNRRLTAAPQPQPQSAAPG